MHIQKFGKLSFSLWFDKERKSLSINAEKKQWPPRLSFHENGGRRKNGDKCFDCTLIVWTVCFSYTNWALQKKTPNTDFNLTQPAASQVKS